MQEILFLLLPLAFYSGWNAAYKRSKKQLEQSSPHAEPSSHFVEGINFLLNEEPDKALDAFLDAPVVDGQTAETFLSLGNMFRNRGEVNRALRVHQYLVARPDLSTQQRQAAMLALGEDFFAAGLLDRAESVFREIIAKYPDNTAACEPLRHIYEQLQDWDKAIELTRRQGSSTLVAAEKNRFIAHYYCEQAAALIQTNQLYQADENLRNALSVFPESARVKVLQGDLALSRHERDQALDYYMLAIARDGRLLGALTARLLDTFTARDDLNRLYAFILDLYQQQKNVLYFPALLSIAQASGHQDATTELIRQHVADDPLSIQTVARSAFVLAQNEVPAEVALPLLDQGLLRLAKTDVRFQCSQCGYKMQDYVWRCPACHQWDTVQNS